MKKIVIISCIAAAIIFITIFVISILSTDEKVDQMELIKLGVDQWNEWKVDNTKEEVNLDNLHMPKTDLKNINLSGASLINSRLFLSKLENADLTRTNLSGANLSSANLIKAKLYRANLSQANFAGADLTRAGLKGAIINGKANFKGCNLTNVDLYGLPVSHFILINADLNGAVINKRWTGYVKSQKVKNYDKIKWTR